MLWVAQLCTVDTLTCLNIFESLPPGVAANHQVCVLALAGLMPSVRRCRVLRLHEGDCLEVCDGRGNLVTAQLRGVTHKKRAYAEAVEGVRQARAPFQPEVLTRLSRC